MEPYVITIGRELGSGGKSIGQIMAKALNIPIYDSRLIKLAAKESGFNPELFREADEVTNKGFFASVVRTIASPFTNIGDYNNSGISNESLFQMQTEIIRKKAETENCIIVGRCADYILRNHPRHLNLFIRADYNDRVEFLAKRMEITPEKARQLIDRTDNQRSEYHNFYCETNWGDSRAYDLCVNSSLLGLEGTAQFLLDFAAQYLHINDNK